MTYPHAFPFMVARPSSLLVIVTLSSRLDVSYFRAVTYFCEPSSDDRLALSMIMLVRQTDVLASLSSQVCHCSFAQSSRYACSSFQA